VNTQKHSGIHFRYFAATATSLFVTGPTLLKMRGLIRYGTATIYIPQHQNEIEQSVRKHVNDGIC